ncbi:UNKNOWN [Stylonychia lemnae]|uniref:Uncharacterized protein n=1 Tax=Stylonychia lemnae TaxID=5949 RepID=A0A078A7H3_STYLE|nr:UNKNOWN [Stylonychia lemnae]|eukprot:CDW78200.1 UNKNOWN [Stylonychia lemnae]
MKADSSSTSQTAAPFGDSSAQQLNQKKRTYSEFSENLKEDNPNQDSVTILSNELILSQDRKRRKQLAPSKIDEEKNQQVELRNFTQNHKAAGNNNNLQGPTSNAPVTQVKSFKSFKEKKLQQQQPSFGAESLNQGGQKNETQLQMESQGGHTQSFYQESQHPDLKDDEDDDMDIDPEVRVNTNFNKMNQQQKKGQMMNNMNLNKKFDENLNLKSINDIDKSLLSDWSLKTSIEISCILSNSTDKVDISFSKIQKYLQYYVYSTDQKLSGFDNFVDKEQQKTQQKVQWLRSLRDAYKKFLASASEDGSIRGVEMPFFYVRNNNFMALFKIKEGRPMAILNPSKTNIIKTVVNISHDDDEEREQQENLRKQKEKEEESDDDLINDQDRLTYLLENNEENQHFNFAPKNQSQLYYFDNKAVNSIYNILSNFIANQMDAQLYSYQGASNSAMAQIIAPSPFINCTYNEGQLFYSGNVTYANKQSRYQMKLFGVFFPVNLTSMIQVIKSQIKASSMTVQSVNSAVQDKTTQQSTDKEIEVQMRSDDQSKLFSYKKCIRMIKLSTGGQNQQQTLPNNGGNHLYKIMFD